MKKRQILLLTLLLSMIVFPIWMLNTDFSNYFLKGIGAIMSVLTLLWIISLVIKDASIIDIYWGFGFVMVAWVYAFIVGFDELMLKHKIFLAMVTLWGLRLAIYLGNRNLGKGEDYRYVEMRKNGGKNWWVGSYFRVFLLQGILAWIISSFYVLVFLEKSEMGIFEYIGIAIWLIGFYFEVAGDYQLSKFKKNESNKGKVMDKGVWRYTRHPNYFGDATLWWGFFFFALAHPNGIFFIFAPLLMTFLLLKISGVAMLERGLVKTKPKYEEYIRKTSSFIPMPPKT